MAEKSNLFATVICNIGNIGLFIFNLFYFYAMPDTLQMSSGNLSQQRKQIAFALKSSTSDVRNIKPGKLKNA